MARYPHAVLGGTFDHLHVGHEALLATAFRIGRDVAIGLTTDHFLRAHPKPDGRRIEPFATRRRRLVRWLRAEYPRRRWRVVPIEDAFGGSVLPGVDVLVVSADTVAGGRAVNRARRRRGLPAVPLVVVPLALADDLEPIGSRRIRSGVIDRCGRRRTPIRVRVRVSHLEDASSARAAVRSVLPTARVQVIGPPSARGALDRPSAELELIVRRRRDGGWSLSERSPHLRLPPRIVAGGSSRALEAGLRRLLHPGA